MKTKKCFTKIITIFSVLFLSANMISYANTENTEVKILNSDNATLELYTNTEFILSMVLSDDKNTLWVGTTHGLAEIDAQTGHRKKLYTALDGLPNPYILSLLTDGSGGIWVGTFGGLAYRNADGSWKVEEIPDTRAIASPIKALLSDGSGGIWAGLVGDGLAHRNADGTWEVFKSDFGLSLPFEKVYTIGSIVSDGNGGIWAGTNHDYRLVHRNADGTWEILDNENSDIQITSDALVSDNNGGFWAHTHDGLAHRYQDGTWEVINNINTYNTFINLESFYHFSDGEGSIWVYTNEGEQFVDGESEWFSGLLHLDVDGTWKRFTDESNLPSATVNSIVSDGDDGFWIGTNNGLAYYADGIWKRITYSSDLPSNTVNSLFLDDSGGLWAGTGTDLAHLEADGRWKVVYSDINFVENATWKTMYDFDPSIQYNFSAIGSVHDLISDGNGGLWAGTDRLVHFYADGKVEQFLKDNTGGLVNSILLDDNGGIWAGTNAGLVHFHEDGTWDVFNENNSELPHDRVDSVVPDGNGGIWVETYDQYFLVHLDVKGTWEIFNVRSSDELNCNVFNSLISDGNGGIWIETDPRPAHRDENGAWTLFYGIDIPDTPFSDVTPFLSDGIGGVWGGTFDSGLAHLYADGFLGVFSFENVLGNTSPGKIESLISDDNSGLWIGTSSNGLIHLTFEPEDKDDTISLSTPIIDISVNETQVSISWEAIPDANRYTLFYAPYPYVPESIGSLDMGNQTSLSLELWEGAHFLIAVQAYKEQKKSDISNIELIKIVADDDVEDSSEVESFTNSLGMTFIRIEPGTFMMGSPEDELGRNSDETQHQVTLTQPYYMQTTEVTQGQWKSVKGINPSRFNECGEDCPVEDVSWNDVQDFIQALNELGEGTYALPTEAQWEYAARAGSTTAFASGDITVTGCDYDPNLDEMGWYCGNSNVTYSVCVDTSEWGGSSCVGSHTVAQKKPNAWGLYDMHGNVNEWCQDWYGSYSFNSMTDPEGPTSGSYHVYRGGDFVNENWCSRSAFRLNGSPDYMCINLGFRLVFFPGQ